MKKNNDVDVATNKKITKTDVKNTTAKIGAWLGVASFAVGLVGAIADIWPESKEVSPEETKKGKK